MTTDHLTDTSAGMSTPNDRDKLKIASFRTKEGVWADFTAAANKLGLTATDVIKAAMEQFIAGEYLPSINTGTYTHVNMPSTIGRDEIQELIDTTVSTAISTETTAASIMTVISTLSLLTIEDVSTAIDTALLPLQNELSEVAEFSRNLQGEIATLKRANGRVNKDAVAKPSTPTKSPSEALDLSTATDVSWGAFHQALGLEASNSKKSVELGAIAIAKATEMGYGGWTYSGNKQRFYRQ